MAFNRSLRMLKIAGVAVLCLYLLSWPMSALLWRQITIERVAEQIDHPQVNGVRVEAWANATTVTFRRAPLFPMLQYIESREPHVVGVRLVDPGFSARHARIHAALLEFPDGSIKNLHLVASRGGDSDLWLPFFVNASEFIVHTFHEDALHLPDHFVLRLDLSVENHLTTERQTLSIRLFLKDAVSRGLGFPRV